MPRSPDEVDRWIREHEAQHARDREERRLEDARLVDAVKKHVDTIMQPLAGVPAKLEKLAEVNKEQLEILKDSAEERGRRKERDEIAAKKKTDDELAIETLKAKNQRWQIIAGVVTAIAVALIGAYFAVHK